MSKSNFIAARYEDAVCISISTEGLSGNVGTFSPIYIDNALEAHVSAPYFIGAGKHVTVGEMINHLANFSHEPVSNFASTHRANSVLMSSSVEGSTVPGAGATVLVFVFEADVLTMYDKWYNQSAYFLIKVSTATYRSKRILTPDDCKPTDMIF